MKTHTVIIQEQDVYTLFQKVYEQASKEIVSVIIDVENLRAIITMKMEDKAT